MRSIRIGAVLSVQDMASLRTDGSGGENDLERILANCSKFILKTFDTKTMDWAEKFIGKRKVEKSKYIKNELGENEKIADSDIEWNESAIIDPKILPDMMYGCGMFISGSTPTIVQSYYVGGEPSSTYVCNMEPITE